MTDRTQRSNITLAFITLVGVVVIVSVIGFFTFRKGTEIIQGQAEATEYRVSSKRPMWWQSSRRHRHWHRRLRL